MDKMGDIRNMIDQLFQVMGIKRVIFVDDVFDTLPDIEIVIGLCIELGSRTKAIIPEFANINPEASRAILSGQISTVWNTLERERRLDIVARLRNASEDHQEDYQQVSVLKEVFEGGEEHFEYVELHPGAWNNGKQAFLEESHATKTLILFDQILGARSGIDEIAGVLSADKVGNIVCGLVSATFEPEEESDKWEEFAKENDIDKDRFALISKSHLREDEPIGFVISLKRVVLNKHISDLIDLVSEVISSAHYEAKKQVQELDIYNFEQIIFRSSFQEGTWEPDTLFRVFGLFHRAFALKEARARAEIYQLAATMRRLSLIRAKEDYSVKKGLSIREVRKLELYDEGDDLNPHHLPIDQGDIFEKAPGNNKYILLTQSCDLMIRTSDGKRKPAVREGILARIVGKDKGEEISTPERFYKLPYFESQIEKRFYVDLLDIHFVSLLVLDICSFHEEGIATFSVGGNCPDIMIPAWQKHFDELDGFYGRAIKLYIELREKDVSMDMCKDLIKGKFNSGPFTLASVDSDRGSIRFAFKRLRRLRQPYSADLVTNFAHFISRAAFEHDLAGVDI